MSGNGQAHIALNRFGLGARPGETAIIAADPVGWLLGQLSPNGAALVAPVESTAVRFASKVSAAPTTDYTWRLALGATTDAPFLERLALFWSNHLSISVARNTVTPIGVPYENEAIRPFVTGRFLDMLTASQRHPAMLYYLDLQNSAGPNSVRGRAHASYNENYARELLELHTLGVDGGYTQTDVTQLALALTGWLVNRSTGQGVYDPTGHEPGVRSVIGQILPAGDGQTDAALAVLAGHPATAQHVCTKLAAHFVADAPPASLVASMTAAWGSFGNLPAVYAAMLGHPASWSATRAKYKTPGAFIISAARALGLGADLRLLFLQQQRLLGEIPLAPNSPAGFGDDVTSWLTPSGVLLRVNVAAVFGSHGGRSLALPAALLADVAEATALSHSVDILQQVPSRADGYALLLASPEFQWR